MRPDIHEFITRFTSSRLRDKDEIKSMKEELKMRKGSIDVKEKLDAIKRKEIEKSYPGQAARFIESSYKDTTKVSNNLLRDISSYKSKIDREQALANEDHPPASPLKENKLRVSRIHVDAHRMPMYRY